MRAIVEVAPYAIGAYGGSDGGGGGQALLLKSGTTWSVVTMGGGSLAQASYLVSLGVPSATAQSLVTAIGQAGY